MHPHKQRMGLIESQHQQGSIKGGKNQNNRTSTNQYALDENNTISHLPKI